MGHRINNMGHDMKENLLDEKSVEKLAIILVSDNTISITLILQIVLHF